MFMYVHICPFMSIHGHVCSYVITDLCMLPLSALRSYPHCPFLHLDPIHTAPFCTWIVSTIIYPLDRTHKVLIADGGPGGSLHAYISKAAGDMQNFVAAKQASLATHPNTSSVVTKGDWANLQVRYALGRLFR
jgi:hypothetical protein